MKDLQAQNLTPERTSMSATTMQRRALLIALVVIACMGTVQLYPTHTQSPRMQNVAVSARVTCESCTIGMRVIATLGDIDGPGGLEFFPNIVREDRRGRFLLSGVPLVRVFDSSGRFTRTIGRPGNGPGEFSAYSVPVILPGDSVFIFSPSALRGAVFDSSSNYVRSIRLPARSSQLLPLKWPSSFFMAGQVQDRALFGERIHQLDARGERAVIHRSSGAFLGDVLPGEPGLYWGATDHGNIWTYNPEQYRLIRWDSTLTPRVSLTRKHQGFTNLGHSPGMQDPPRTLIVGLAEDRTGLLWIMLREPGKNWREGRKAVAPGQEPRQADEDVSVLYQTTIEVIDPQRGQLISRQTFPGYMQGFLPRLRAIAWAEHPNGSPQVKIVQLSFLRR